MAKAILFINPKKGNSASLANEICRELEKRGFEHESFSMEKEFAVDGISAYDIAFSLGGDGTVLHTVRSMAPLRVPVFPVNLGTLGFMAGIHPDNWKMVFEDWLDGRARLSQRLMLEIKVERQGRVAARSICLNEAVVSSPGIFRLINLDVSLGESINEGEEFLHLGQYCCDGLISATPTGSTAHSAAAGGPILDPELEAFILNPICPFTLSHRPLVLPAGQTVLIEVEPDQKSGIMLTMDGQLTQTLEEGDRIFVSSSPSKGILIASGRNTFYDALKHKFFWMKDPAAPAENKEQAVKHA